MKSLPTPYDITDLPVYAWSPGVNSWILLLSLFLLGALVLFFSWKSSSSRQNASEVLSQAQSAWSSLESALAKESPKSVMARASNILRRLLSLRVDTEVASMGPEKLMEFSRSGNPDYRLLELLARMEEFKFSPGDSSELARQLITQGQTELQQLSEQGKT